MHKKLRIIWLTTLLLALNMRLVAFAEDAEVSTGQACKATNVYACLFEKELIPESCTKYRSEALQAAVDSWCKIQVISFDIPKDDGLRYAKHTPLNPKFRSAVLEQDLKPEIDHRTIHSSHPKTSNELSSNNRFVENEFEDIVTKGETEKKDEYVVGLTFSFRRFSLKSFYNSMLSAVKKPSTAWGGSLTSVSFFLH